MTSGLTTRISSRVVSRSGSFQGGLTANDIAIINDYKRYNSLGRPNRQK